MIYFSDFSATGGGGGGLTYRSGTLDDYFAQDGSTTPILGSATYPAAFYDATDDRTWVAWEAWDGTDRVVRVSVYDHASGDWSLIYDVSSDTLTSDNHGPPAICMDHEGYVHCFFGAHTSAMKYSVTTNARDPSAWTAKTSIGSAATYPHPVLVGSTLYLFTRENTEADWTRRKTTALSGGSATWGSALEIVQFTGDRFYQGNFAVDGTDIHFCAAYSDGADTLRRDIYHFVYDTTNDAIKNSTGSVSTGTGSQPISKATADSSYIVIDQSTNKTDVPSLCITPDGTIHLAYIDDTATPWDIKYVNFNGTSWSSPTTVTTTTGSSVGGFIEEIALVAKSDNSVELWYPDDSSAIWTQGGDMKRIVRSSGGTWGSASTILTADKHGLARPCAVFNANPDFGVIFTEDSQASTDSTGGGLRLFAYGDSGIVQAPRGTYEHFANVVFQAQFTGSNGSTTFTDESNRLQPVTAVGNAQIQSNKLELDATGDWITVPNAQAFRMTEDFCDEYFGVVFDSNTIQQIISSQYTSNIADRGWSFQYRGADATDNLALAFSTNGSAAVFAIQVNWTPTVGVAYDICVRRNNGTLRVCVDGTMVGSSVSHSAVSFASASKLAIGQDNTGSSPNTELDGRMEAVRLHRGVDPYGTNNNYTVPSLPLPTD